METQFGATPVTAIRIFVLNSDKMLLKSLNEEVWMPKEIKRASCNHVRIPKAHSLDEETAKFFKPEVNCTCGIWSCKSRKGLAYSFPHLLPRVTIHPLNLLVSAQIQQWGKVIEHEFGYRSEFARIIPETIAHWPRRQSNAWRNKRVIEFLRRKYGAEE